jgi:hypothetical protein
VEDEGFVDDDFIEEAAREYVGRYGFNSISILRERAGIAEPAGNVLLAQAWREMAEAAKRMKGLDQQ